MAESGRYEIRGGSARGILGATYTGRSIDIEGRYVDATKWMEGFTTSKKVDLKLEKEVLDSLEETNGNFFDGLLYRGRTFVSPPGPSDFGPPPREETKEGRYNAACKPALYLCCSAAGVKREVPIPDGKRLWIQRFRIPSNFRMADARNLAIDSLAAAIFWLIERERASEKPMLGARLGEIIGAKYDGLIVPGVRGGPDALYWNVVIFNPENRWVDLVDHESHPKLLS